jgi:hypothetical protein
MAWRRGINHQALSDLGSLTARLVRLVAFQQVSRGQAQLAAMGVTTDFSGAYATFSRQEARKLKPPQESSLLIVTTKGSIF